MRRFPEFWLRSGDPRAHLLRPLGRLFCHLAGRRRRRLTLRRGKGPAVPVVIVGSIFVGGSGKTPLVIWLVEEALRMGLRPGVILRGYGGGGRDWPRLVDPESDPAEVGDEAVLIARRTGLPVAAGPDRCAARDILIAWGCDLVLSDDGLQHYRLPRHGEIAVLDATLGLGNGFCLPAGPLRERESRLAEVDLVVGNGGPLAGHGEHHYRSAPGPLEAVAQGAEQGVAPRPGSRIHAVAAIGQPERFFRALEAMGFLLRRHAFPDHHAFREGDLPADRPVVMTEKDAVKCGGFGRADLWFLPVSAIPCDATAKALRALLDTARRRALDAVGDDDG